MEYIITDDDRLIAEEGQDFYFGKDLEYLEWLKILISKIE